MLRAGVGRLFGQASRLFARSARILDTISRHLGDSEEIRRVRAVINSTRRHDMLSDANEQYYKNLYWRWIQPFLDSVPANARCLDLGCGQGRFSIPLARQFEAGEVIGIDLSAPAIEAARGNATAAGLSNTNFFCSGLEEYVVNLMPASYDVLMFTEVSFFWPEWRRHLPGLTGSLRAGGLLIASFRPLYFNALCLVQQQKWSELEVLLSGREGYIFGPDVRFSWQHSDEIEKILRAQPGLSLELLTGVGVCSGIDGDPHAPVARPSKIAGSQKYLEAVEFSLGPTIPDAGRYMLAICRKK